MNDWMPRDYDLYYVYYRIVNIDECLKVFTDYKRTFFPSNSPRRILNYWKNSQNVSEKDAVHKQLETLNLAFEKCCNNLIRGVNDSNFNIDEYDGNMKILLVTINEISCILDIYFNFKNKSIKDKVQKMKNLAYVINPDNLNSQSNIVATGVLIFLGVLMFFLILTVGFWITDIIGKQFPNILPEVQFIPIIVSSFLSTLWVIWIFLNRNDFKRNISRMEKQARFNYKIKNLVHQPFNNLSITKSIEWLTERINDLK